MNEQKLHMMDERILRLEKRFTDLHRTRLGLSILGVRNILGQDTEVIGDLYVKGNITSEAGSTVGGVDVGAHVLDPNAHHDAVSVVDSGTIDFTLTDQQITAIVIQSAIDHGSIAGLSDDDHPQYLLANGSRQLTGNLAVANGITIDGVDVSAHAANASAHHNPVTVADSTTIDFSLTGQQVSGSVIQSAIDHGSIGGLSDDDHVQYFNAARHTLAVHTGLGLAIASRQIISGNGLTGGGDLSADRTLAVGAGTGISVAADSVAINLAANLTWTGNHIFQGGLSTRHLLPETNDAYDLGSNSKLWRKAWLSELDTVLFAQNSVTLLGGWLVVSKDEGSLVSDVAAAATKIDFGKAMTVADFVLLRSSNQVEYIQVGTLDSGTTYNVTRNLDGSGANDWAGGTPFVVLGYTGNGRIELNAYDTPRLSIIEQGSAYNAITERIRIGDLASWQSAGLTGYGIAIGNYAGNEYLAYSPAGGLIVRGTINADDGFLKNLTVNGLLNLDTTGELRAGTTSDGLRFGYISDGYYLRGIGGGVTQVEIRASDGKLYAGGGDVWIDEDGLKLSAKEAFMATTSIMWYGEHDPIVNNAGIQAREPYTSTPPMPVQMELGLFSHAGTERATIYLESESGYELANIFMTSYSTAGSFALKSYMNLEANKINFLGGIDGWISLSRNFPTPEYVSATQIKFSGVDVTEFFTVGTKVRITQTTTKYFYVIGTSYSGGNTTITVTGGSDYTVANATITSFDYSNSVSPQGFPHWFNYDSGWRSFSNPQPAIGNGTIVARFCIVGKLVKDEIILTAGSTTTYGTSLWYFDTPTSHATKKRIGIAFVEDANTNIKYTAVAVGGYSPNEIVINHPGTANWFSSTVPITWAQSDVLSIDISYELP